MPEPTAATERPRHQFIKLSLRLAMVLIALLAVCLAWLTNHARRQTEVVKGLRGNGGEIGFDYEYPPGAKIGWAPKIPGAQPPGPRWLRRILSDEYFRTIVMVNWRPLRPARVTGAPVPRPLISGGDDELLRKLIGLGGLKHLTLAYPDVSDRGLLQASGLNDLETLQIYFCAEITDEGLAVLPKMRRLTTLSIQECPITDRSLAFAAQRPTLEVLALNSPTLTDEGLIHLRSLSRLERLALISPKITDRGIENLEGLSGLKWLGVLNAALTDTAFLSISKLTTLEGIGLTGQFTDEGLATLHTLSKLNQIRLVATQGTLTDRALKTIEGFKKLEFLELGNSRKPCTLFSDEALIELVNALPALRILDLEKQYQGNRALKQLQKSRPGLTIRFWR